MLLLRDVKSSKKGSRFETRPTRYNIGVALKSLHAEFTAHIPLELFRCPYPCGRPVQAFQSIGVTGLKVKHIVPSSHGHFDHTPGVILATQHRGSLHGAGAIPALPDDSRFEPNR